MNAYDVAVLGGGIAGFSAALRLQRQGLRTLVLEAHGQLGGCAGFFRRRGFSFDVGATTLVDFELGGVGGRFLAEVGLPLPPGEYLDYQAWLPDRQLTLYRDPEKWRAERLAKLGATASHQAFWQLLDTVTEVFWAASRDGIKLPLQSLGDATRALRLLGWRHLPLARYLPRTCQQVLVQFGLAHDQPLRGLLSMLVEDTVHSTLSEAPFINAALGCTIRGAGLLQPTGGMQQFWQQLAAQYLHLGGTLKKGHRVLAFGKEGTAWRVATSKGAYRAAKLISALPLDVTNALVPAAVQARLAPHWVRNESLRGGAVVVFLGVPEVNLAGQALTHHQLLQDYGQSLSNGNNMFISASAAGDTLSAPPGYRAVMVSTHCELADWANLTPAAYKTQKQAIGGHLAALAKRVYPDLDREAVVYEVATPLTYQKFTGRPGGAVGGFRQTLRNANLRAVPQDIGLPDFWLAGDNTWPGLGTVAGLISGRIAA